jgi:hypothetical protein
MRDAIDSNETMWPTKTVGRPGICISHTCVDWILLPSWKLIVRGEVATPLLATSAPSMMNIDVAPVSAIAWFAAIVRALRYCSIGLPNIALAVAANNGTINFCVHFLLEQFEITTVDLVGGVGSRELEVAETKLLHLCATANVSAPRHQLYLAVGSIDLCIPLVLGLYPAAMNCCAFLRVYPVWWFAFRNRHV